MKRKYINPKNRIVDLKLEGLVCTSPASAGINKDEPYTGDGAVEVRAQGWVNNGW